MDFPDPHLLDDYEIEYSEKYHDFLIALCRRLCPDASEQELDEAATNLQRYLAVCARIYRRLERETKI